LPSSVEGVPQSAVHESLTTEYLLVGLFAVLILTAPLAKQLLKILPAKVVGSLTREVF
jgi:hypothetical protein